MEVKVTCKCEEDTCKCEKKCHRTELGPNITAYYWSGIHSQDCPKSKKHEA